MRITDTREGLVPARAGSVISIGVFDGVHLGHRAILDANVARARELDAEATVVTFRHHPKGLLLGRAPRTLTTLEHRLELFAEAGIDHTLALAFDDDLRRMEAEAFLRAICLEGLAARHFVLGFDSRFGHDRTGTADHVAAMGHSVEVVPKVVVHERAVSSTAIRESVELGDLASAESMLGRRVAILGAVEHGEALGRRLGFPTANLNLHHELHPPPGVYAGLARCVDREDKRLWGAAVNIGFRPTVSGSRPDKPRIEVHLVDFEGDLYGERLEVLFLKPLRGEVRFNNLDELRSQIERDVVAARKCATEALGGD